MILEIWKSITTYEGLYEVSNLGRVKSLKFGKERILKPQANTNGYLIVALCKNGKAVLKLVSVLVAEAFIPNPKNKLVVDHINKVLDDNRVENLQWLTYSENNKKGYDQGRVTSEKNRLATKEASQIVSTWINEKLNLEFIGNSLDLVRAFSDQKLKYQNLSKVRTGKRKQHKGWEVLR